MLRIGDAARRFGISNRTLRHWEDEGILRSARAENGYRFYDECNAMRIEQIVLLRKLDMPITEIERIFVAGDHRATIDILARHLENLRREMARHQSLADFTEKLIGCLQPQDSLEQVFARLKTETESAFPAHGNALPILLSERNGYMSTNRMDHLRIVKLPAMVVASYTALSAAPEQDCAKVFNKLVLENELHKRAGYRFFGFNNPNPAEDDLVYGYEM